MVHSLAPALLNCPQGHDVLVPSPLHAKPAGQMVQLVRVLPSSPPPLVNEPVPQTLQFAAPLPLNLLSAPHGCCSLLPSHS